MQSEEKFHKMLTLAYIQFMQPLTCTHSDYFSIIRALCTPTLPTWSISIIYHFQNWTTNQNLLFLGCVTLTFTKINIQYIHGRRLIWSLLDSAHRSANRNESWLLASTSVAAAVAFIELSMEVVVRGRWSLVDVLTMREVDINSFWLQQQQQQKSSGARL